MGHAESLAQLHGCSGQLAHFIERRMHLAPLVQEPHVSWVVGWATMQTAQTVAETHYGAEYLKRWELWHFVDELMVR